MKLFQITNGMTSVKVIFLDLLFVFILIFLFSRKQVKGVSKKTEFLRDL